MASTILIGLDGIERELSEALGQTCGESHGLNTTTGMILRKTSLTGGAHEDIAEFSYDDLLAASQAKGRLIDELGYGARGYAVLDSIYACGCRGMG